MPTVTVNGVDRSTSYRPEQLQAIQIRQIAFDGEVGQGSFPIPDGDGSYEVYAGQAFLVEDGTETIIDGFVGGTERERGDGVVPPRREVSHSLIDENALLYGFRAYKWKRPRETDRARFLAFLADFVPEVTDTTWVLNTNTRNLPAKSYRTENLFTELLDEIRDRTGKTAFIVGRAAHLHLPTEGDIAPIAISDQAFDFATSFPPYNPTRAKDPQDLGNDILVVSPSGTTTVTDPTSISRHDAGGVKHQRLLELTEGDADERQAQGNALLQESKNERITYECDIGPLTAAQVNQLPPGALINVTSQVWGLSGSTQRIAARTLTYHHPGKWFAHLELGYPIRIRQKPPRTPTPVTDAPTPEEDETTTVNGTVQQHIKHLYPGITYAAGLVTSAGFGLETSAPAQVGYTFSNFVVAGPGFACPAGHQWHDPAEHHVVLRFDTSALSRPENGVLARLKGRVIADAWASGGGGSDPGRAGSVGAYEIATGAYFSPTADATDLTEARFRAGASVAAIDLTTARDCGETIVDLPISAVNFGGITDLVVRPVWQVAEPIVCGPASATNRAAAIGCEVAPPVTLTILTLDEAGVRTPWYDAIVATSSDDASVPAGNEDDQASALWWKVPAMQYQPRRLEVAVGGRILIRDAEWFEDESGLVFRIVNPTGGPVPAVRYVTA